MNKSFIAAVVVFLLVSGVAAAASPLSDHMDKVAETERLILYADLSTGDIVLLDKANGFHWPSIPADRQNDRVARGIFRTNLSSQLLVSYVNLERNQTYARNTFAGSVQKGNAQVSPIVNGIRVDYEFANEGLVIPLEITIANDYLQVVLPVEEIQELGDNYVVSIGVMPYFGAGSTQDQGYMFVPDGSGALIQFNNGKERYAAYEEPIYNRDQNFELIRQSVVKQSINLPVFGITHEDSALLGVITKGAGAGSIRADVSGSTSSYNHVYPQFTIRASDQYSFNEERSLTVYDRHDLQLDQIQVRYYCLSSENADYSGMARRYRQYLVDDVGIVPQITDRASLYVDLFGAVMRRKSFLGFPMDRVEPLTTFEEAQEIVQELRSVGIEDIVLRYRNWSREGLSRKVPTRVTPLRHLGGKQEFEELIRALSESSVEFYPEINFIEFARSGNGFSKIFDATRNLSRAPTVIREHLLSTFYRNPERKTWRLLKPQSVVKAVDTFKNQMNFSVEGLSPHTLGSIVYSDFSGDRSIRTLTEELWCESLAQLADSWDLVMESPHAYALPFAKHVISVPQDSSHFDITDRAVPFYQMVLSGLIPYTTPAVNLHAEPELLFLRAVETGSLLYYSWIYKDPAVLKETPLDRLYSGDFRLWIDSAQEQYEQIRSLKALTDDSPIYSHEMLQENVYKTCYENGIEVVINYNQYDVEVGGCLVAGRDYYVCGGGGQK